MRGPDRFSGERGGSGGSDGVKGFHNDRRESAGGMEEIYEAAVVHLAFQGFDSEDGSFKGHDKRVDAMGFATGEEFRDGFAVALKPGKCFRSPTDRRRKTGTLYTR